MSEFKPGDPPPQGYLDWHRWAAVQGRAGLQQKTCGKCGLWRFPQEMAADGGKCLECVSKEKKA